MLIPSQYFFQINTIKGNKYIYIPSDLENNGYSPFGEYDNTYHKTIHGYLPTNFYSYELIDNIPYFKIENNHFVTNDKISNIKVPSDYLTALNINNTFSDVTNNIVIYQEAHHSLNNSKEAIDLLNLNSSMVYTISPSGNPKNSYNFHTVETSYLLSNTKNYYTGSKNRNGVKCIIKADATTSCDNY